MLLFSAEKGEIFVSTINGSNLLAANFVGDFISNMAGPCALKKNKHLRILFRVIHHKSFSYYPKNDLISNPQNSKLTKTILSSFTVLPSSATTGSHVQKIP